MCLSQAGKMPMKKVTKLMSFSKIRMKILGCMQVRLEIMLEEQVDTMIQEHITTTTITSPNSLCSQSPNSKLKTLPTKTTKVS